MKPKHFSFLQALPYFLLAGAFLIQSFVALGPYFWFFELFTHYAPYYATLALGMAAIHFYKKNALLAATWSGFFLINLIPFAPYLYQSNAVSQNPESQALTVFAQNVYYETTDTSEFFGNVAELQPDVFVVNEANAIWGSTQSEVLRQYPYTALTEKTGVHGIFMGSQTKGTFTSIPLGNQMGLEFIPSDHSYRVLGVHPDAPLTPSWAEDRNAQFADLVIYAQSSSIPTVIIGDFNCTPWSPYFVQLLKNSELKDSRLGFGFKSTWKANNPLFWLPIDHALVSSNFQVLGFKTFSTELSDHKAIEVKLSF